MVVLEGSKIRAELMELRATLRIALAKINQMLAEEDPGTIKVGDESDDPLDYRGERDPEGTLNERGVRVMYQLFEAGLTSEQVADRMKVSINGVRNRRRLWLRNHSTTN